jgi:glycosidase
MTVGELPNTPEVERVLSYVSAKEKRLDMVFNFDAVSVGQGREARFNTYPFSLPDFKIALSRWQISVIGTDAWTTAFLENHDQGRSISRFASDAPEYRVNCGKMLALLSICLTGTLFIYQGQEIGMINIPKTWPIEDYKCIKSTNHYNMVMDFTDGDPTAMRSALEGIQAVARDHARTPMHWDASANAGFTKGGEPWMRVHDEYLSINVKKQTLNPGSVLSFWKRMLRLRKQYSDLLIYGDYEVYDVENTDTFIFSKTFKEERMLVVLNFTAEKKTFQNPLGPNRKLQHLVNSSGTPVDTSAPLAPYEGRLYLVK